MICGYCFSWSRVLTSNPSRILDVSSILGIQLDLYDSVRGIAYTGDHRTMHIEIHDTAVEARIRKQIQATGAATAEEALLHLLETQEEQDRWLMENQSGINAKIWRGIAQLERGGAY